MSGQVSSFRQSDVHTHSSLSLCPTCDQPVANEKLNEITAKQAEKDRLAEAGIRNQLNKDFSIRIAKIEADAKAEQQKVASDNTANVEKLKQEAVDREDAARKAAEASYQEKLVDAERQRLAAEAALKQAKQDADNREAEAHKESAALAEESWKSRFDELNSAKENAESQVSAIASNQQQRLDEQRLSLEKARDDAVNAEIAKGFENELRLTTQLANLQRQWEKKTADELGEGAEVKLYEELKAHFDGDKFHHVGKGNAGADIIQEVIQNGQVCGKIIFDSKDRNAWRNDFVSKLLVDQVAEGVEHAILSSRVFPAGAKQIQIQDGVIIANPARVVTIVELLRKQIINSFRLRLSAESRTEKTAAL